MGINSGILHRLVLIVCHKGQSFQAKPVACCRAFMILPGVLLPTKVACMAHGHARVKSTGL